jgi:hypothetical protein
MSELYIKTKVLHHVLVFTTNHIIVDHSTMPSQKTELSDVPEDDTRFVSKHIGQKWVLVGFNSHCMNF